MTCTSEAREHVITGTTGRILKERLERTIDALDFFWDPLEPQPHDPRVKALLRIATLWNIPVASNRATANMIVISPRFSGTCTRILPAFLRRADTPTVSVG
jgi:methylglyoxal synthase